MKNRFYCFCKIMATTDSLDEFVLIEIIHNLAIGKIQELGAITKIINHQDIRAPTVIQGLNYKGLKVKVCGVDNQAMGHVNLVDTAADPCN